MNMFFVDCGVVENIPFVTHIIKPDEPCTLMEFVDAVLTSSYEHMRESYFFICDNDDYIITDLPHRIKRPERFHLDLSRLCVWIDGNQCLRRYPNDLVNPLSKYDNRRIKHIEQVTRHSKYSFETIVYDYVIVLENNADMFIHGIDGEPIARLINRGTEKPWDMLINPNKNIRVIDFYRILEEQDGYGFIEISYDSNDMNRDHLYKGRIDNRLLTYGNLPDLEDCQNIDQDVCMGLHGDSEIIGGIAIPRDDSSDENGFDYLLLVKRTLIPNDIFIECPYEYADHKTFYKSIYYVQPMRTKQKVSIKDFNNYVFSQNDLTGRVYIYNREESVVDDFGCVNRVVDFVIHSTRYYAYSHLDVSWFGEKEPNENQTIKYIYLVKAYSKTFKKWYYDYLLILEPTPIFISSEKFFYVKKYRCEELSNGYEFHASVYRTSDMTISDCMSLVNEIDYDCSNAEVGITKNSGNCYDFDGLHPSNNNFIMCSWNGCILQNYSDCKLNSVGMIIRVNADSSVTLEKCIFYIKKSPIIKVSPVRVEGSPVRVEGSCDVDTQTCIGFLQADISKLNKDIKLYFPETNETIQALFSLGTLITELNKGLSEYAKLHRMEFNLVADDLEDDDFEDDADYYWDCWEDEDE